MIVTRKTPRSLIVSICLALLLSLQTGIAANRNRDDSEHTLMGITLDAYLSGMVKRDKFPYREIKRKILGIYDSHGEIDAFGYNQIQLHAAMVLNHLGYVVEPLDIRNTPLPDKKTMEKYDVILSWFNQPSVHNGIEYLIWLERQARLNKKIIILGYTGLEVSDRTGESYSYDLKARALRLIGLEYRGFNRNASPRVFIESERSDGVGFERKFKKIPGEYAWIVPLKGSGIKTWLSIGHKDFPDGESSVIVTSPKGGYAMNGYVTWNEPDVEESRYKWMIDPFQFFEEILGNRAIPVPDPTTKNGKRLFFSHIDGDSSHSFSQVEKGKYASEIIFDFISREIPEIPVGVSFVVAEIDHIGIKGSEAYMIDPSGKKDKDGNPIWIKGRRGNKRLIENARNLARLPNVELASHTYHHPYTWRGGDTKKTSAYKRGPFDVEFEIKESIHFINKYIAPEGKKVEVLFWSGDTTPGLKAFEILESIQIKNINGGDGVYDAFYNSLTSVSPYGRKAGKYWQVFSCQSNENLYTDLWRNYFSGFSNVIETFKRTESPRRLQCANIYYHFYSGDKVASLGALRKVYNWIKKQDYEYVFPSEYAAIVNGFFHTRIFQIAKNRYVIANRGKLNTLRLDKRDVDEERSRGIIKIVGHNDSYYISLDPAEKYPVIQIN